MFAAPARPVFRFAPSPNGYLHVGHAYSALKNTELARRSDGRMLVRIEDIDTGRARPLFERAILEDLAWLGIRWEEPVRRQSEHSGDYAAALARLDALGLLYPCFCTRREIAAAAAGSGSAPLRDPDGEPLYPGTCKALEPAQIARRLAAGEPASRRIDMRRALAVAPHRIEWIEYREGSDPHAVAAEPAAWGDAVMARKDIGTSYTVAVVVDDAQQGVSDVVRGEDLFAATALQRLLQDLLGLPAPRYHHHALMRDETGAKLSKSIASTALRDLRAKGMSAGELRRRLGFG